jgi:serine/threonine-protein kinase
VAHGDDDAGPCLVEGFLEGCDLDTLIARKGPLPEVGVRSIFDSGLACLRTLHDAADAEGSLELVHGDLSPGNLFILPSGEVRLVDFELGSLRGLPRPDDGTFRGTLQYASPRVVRGAAPTAADDRFGLAACMLFALAGTLPRPERGPQLMLASGDAPPPVPTLGDHELEHALRLALGDAPE